MAEYVTTDASGKVTREPKGRGRPRAGYEQRDNGDWYNVGTAIAVVRTATIRPTPAPNIVEDEDTDLADVEKLAVPLEASSADEGKISSITKVKCPIKITVDTFLRTLNYNSKNIDINDERIRIRVLTTGTQVIPGVGANAVYGQISINLKTGTVEVLDASPAVWPVSSKKIISDALVDLEPAKWQQAIRRS